MLVFQIFALSNTLPWIFWFAYRNTSENTVKNHTQFLCEPGTRHSIWDCCEATSILGLNLNHVPFSSHFASKHHPLPTQVFGLTWWWHLHVRAYRCNQIILHQIRIPWPWRSLLACWWPGTFKNTSGFRKIIKKNRERLFKRLLVSCQSLNNHLFGSCLYNCFPLLKSSLSFQV